ncbi:MAG TPA: hypothetical protein VFD77_07370 [Brumimicrobium sp.]|nr:hypothetical protein [Brumimicrobium sp.]
MNYKALVVVDDDSEDILRNFRLKSEAFNMDVKTFNVWDKTKEFIQQNQDSIDGIILDARGKLNNEKSASEAHLFESFSYVKNLNIPYAIYTAYTKELPMLEEQLTEGKVFTKGRHKEEDVFKFLKKEIQNSPKLKVIKKYPEPFQCFGGSYLDKKYELLLLNIIKVYEDGSISNPETLLFNPCRVILERVFEKINEVDETILPYALLSFEKQRAGLVNCQKHLSGIPYKINNERVTPTNFLKNSCYEYISKQLDIIITVCHPASHDIQARYSSYTFKSVLWALFDVLIWLKEFIDKRS